MSLIYNFKFDTRYAGQSVHVYDSGQTEVAGSPFTLDAAGDYAYTADAADRYTGKVSNPAVFAGDGYSVVDGELDVPASIAAGGGGGGTTDGVGAVFFGGADLIALPDNQPVYCDFEAVNDGARNPQRDDLMVIDAEDPTVINVVTSGLYTVTVNTPVRVTGLVFSGAPSLTEVVGKVQFGVNGESVPPAYDYNNRAYWIISEDNQTVASVALNHTFDQELQAGDTVRLSFRCQQAGNINEAVGGLEMNPDLTMQLTYRGPVAA